MRMPCTECNAVLAFSFNVPIDGATAAVRATCPQCHSACTGLDGARVARVGAVAQRPRVPRACAQPATAMHATMTAKNGVALICR